MIARRLKINLHPSQTLQRREAEGHTTYTSYDNDPFFQIIPDKKIIKAGWYIISYTFKLHKGTIVLPKVYFDFGDGYLEKFHWRLFFHDNEIFGLVKVPWNCYKIRLDLSENNIEFEPGEIKLTKVNKAHAALQLFTILDKLGESRTHFLKNLLSQRSLKDQKALLKSLFEGNYLSLDYQQAPVKQVATAPATPADNTEELLTYSSIDAAKLERFRAAGKKIAQLKTRFKPKQQAAVDIILPVYNGLAFLEKLIPQIMQNSDLPFTLYVIDDCSPDEQVPAYLAKVQASYKNIRVQHNQTNLGFTKTVNKLIKSCTSDIIVLLNSDIEVPANWLSRLVAPLLIDDKIGTITPISNCATICSFPNLGDNELLKNYDVEKMNVPLKTTELYYEEIPTGVGFCMVLNKKMLSKVGLLNEEMFPRGYGEEVDLCFRARKKGFKNVLNTSLFVYHKHGGSFTSTEKVRLMQENQMKVETLHPDFTPVLQQYFKENTFVLVKLVYLLKLALQEGKTLSLFLDHDLGGGTNLYSRNYQSEHPLQVFLYGQYINPNRNAGKQILFTVTLYNYQFKFGLNDINILFQILIQHKIELSEIIINNLVSYNDSIRLTNQLIAYKQSHKVTLKVLCHDFYYICPNFLLFRDNVEFCGVPNDIQVCTSCISNLAQNIDAKLVPNDFESLPQWRENWRVLLEEYTDELVAFSESTKRIFLKMWPKLEAKAVVRPHTLKGFTKYNKRIYRIGILGNIHSVPKGAKVVQDLANYVAAKNLYNFKLINFGGLHPLFDHDLIEKKGPYNLGNLHYELLQNKIDVILIPSVCSETFSFTTREAIETGIPTACFNFGGQYDQVVKYDKGIIVNEIKPEALISAIESYFEGVNA